MAYAYKSFVPQVWAEAINRELEKALVYKEDCNTQYEGNVSKAGDTVHILGVGQPSITTTTGDSHVTLSGAEDVEDTSVIMKVNQLSYFNYKVDDVDKRQAVGGLMDALSKEATYACADTMDAYIANMSKAQGAVKKDSSATSITTSNILNYIDAGLEVLYGKNVRSNDDIVITVPPWFYTKFKEAYIKLDTNNSEMLKNGKVAMYGNVTVKMTNNVAVDTNSNSLIQLKTKRAIAFANPMTHTEAYRPENGFSDAVKGFVLYDAKIVRPKEMVILNCKAGAEA